MRRTIFLAACVLGLAAASALPPVAVRAEPGALRAALAQVAARDWDAALAAARPAGQVAVDIVLWHQLRSGDARLDAYEDFLRRRPDWPGIPWLLRQGETAVARSETPARVIAWFHASDPQTAAGAIALVRALRVAGDSARADAVAVAAWRDLAFDAEEQAELLALAGPALAGHHVARLDRLLWANRSAEAGRMLPLVPEGWQALARARMGLRDGAAGVDALIAAVPADLAADPGLAHARFEWRAQRSRDADAVALLLERSGSAAALGDPAAWAGRRAFYARAALREGAHARAHAIAAGHGLTAGGAFADMEFLAGFIALRRLNDPARALAHFRTLGAGVSTPISLSRAAYWEGRALEAAGRPDQAAAALRRAAMYQTTYYGLLAAERAGLPLDPALLGGERFADWRQAGFMRDSVLEAGLMLYRAGDAALGRRFLLHLAEGLDRDGLGQLADLALDMDRPDLAVLIAKQGAERGLILPGASFPTPAMVPEGLPVPRALALSIARRESEFDPRVISPAGARGLMQVMPGTAQMMATRLGLTYSAGALLSDPAYNVRLGAAYLAQLIEEFGPSVALVAAGYNAGPGRPRTWMADLGDPRRADADAMTDWVELVPFAETRTYIMRVAESLVIYRARLAGQGGPVVLTDLLTGRAG